MEIRIKEEGGLTLTIYELDLAQSQLSRMRGMTRYYHQRFFNDIRFTTVGVIGLLLIGFWSVPEAFLLVPVVTLIGANQTAFDASYLYFARHYAADLEAEINSSMRRRVLVGAELEDVYLFPLDRRKVVAIGYGNDFTWFGWMTVLYTTLGVSGYGFGLALGWPVLTTTSPGWLYPYLGVIGLLTVGSLAVGWWWFIVGTGERRLRAVLDSRFGEPVRLSSVTSMKR